MKVSEGPLILAGTQRQGPNLCQLRRQEAAVYPSGSSWVICLCKQPFAQVSRGAAEGTRTSAFVPSNGEERPAVTLHFSRHPSSGKLVSFCPSLEQDAQACSSNLCSNHWLFRHLPGEIPTYY